MVVLIKKIILKPSATDGFSGEDKRERERMNITDNFIAQYPSDF